MNNQQSYQTSNYRGNMQGHDAYLRSDSSSPSMMSSSTSGYSNQQQQQQPQQSFQPTGNVPSFYGQGQMGGNQQNQQYQQGQSAQSFHTANYRGNQPGHDQYLRSDSQSPSNQAAYGSNMSQGNSSGMGMGNQENSYSNNMGAYGQSNNQSFHTANYRGDQQGHDRYLRSDSQQPSQSGAYGMSGYNNSGGMNQSPQANSFSTFTNQQIPFIPTQQNQQNQSYGQSAYQAQNNPQSFHTANYRGNQPGHDSYLRSDSNQPSRQGF